jgi:hypothetical protein
MDLVVARELQVLGSHGLAAHDYPRLLALVATRHLPLARLVRRTLPLDAGPRALADFGAATAPEVTVLRPSPGATPDRARSAGGRPRRSVRGGPRARGLTPCTNDQELGPAAGRPQLAE